MSNLLIIGAGGHGRVVADAASLSGAWSKVAFLDDRFPMEKHSSWLVIGSTGDAVNFLEDYSDLIVGIGNNELRVKLLQKYKALGFNIPTIIHPRAVVSNDASAGEGTFIAANAVVNIGAQIGPGGIINTNSTVEHDCTLGQGVHVSPGANVAGEVTIGDYSWVGIGSSVIQGITIGSRTIIGAGSVVIHPVEDSRTVVGVPARVIK
jgi:sugar O-acyltransferase (sialic acid O-acetyltransferase NeuD family)